MSDERFCPECGKPIAAGSKGTLCPNCLLQLGLEDSPAPAGNSELSTQKASGSLPGLPERIGNYRILQKVGEGGMGEVYLAEQEEPVRRRVALKVIKHGMDTKQVVARFESERQALALMNHPNIARVFDAGATGRGRPYFVMEYVSGVPITKYCDESRLSTEDRLELFMQVCEGVQHAHQKGVIHRDIKPSNVLVMIQDGRPVPKIIDFGVAKATEQRLTEKTVFTQLGAMIGTPEYMSPEQAELSGLDVDTRSDVYSLGVMLYELLVGALPFDPKELRQAGFEGVVRKIREEEPPKPSTRLSTLGEQSTESAQRRRVDVSTLQRQLRGDLDWITMRALEKSRTRRYGSPQELAADIERHLRDEPVLAGPPSMAYRAKKFVRRHKLGVGVATAGLVVLIAFAVAMAYQANRIARERDRSELEAETAREVSEFLSELFEVADPTQAKGDTITARMILDRGRERIERELLNRPLLRARLMTLMGSIHRNLGMYDEAKPLLETALRDRRALLGNDDLETLESLREFGFLLQDIGNFEEAETIYRELLETRRRVLGSDDPSTLESANDLAAALQFQGRVDESLDFARQALEGRRRVLGEEDPATLTSTSNVAELLRHKGKMDEAEALLREGLAHSRNALGSHDPTTLLLVSTLAALLGELGRFEEAEPYYRESLEGHRRVYGDHHSRTLIAVSNQGYLMQNLGRLDEAVFYYAQALRGHRQLNGDQHPATLVTMGNLGDVYASLGQLEEGHALLVEALEGVKVTFPREHLINGFTTRKYGACLTRLGRYEQAQNALLEAHEILVSTVGEENPQTLKAVANLVELYDAWNKPSESERWRNELPVGSVDGAPSARHER